MNRNYCMISYIIIVEIDIKNASHGGSEMVETTNILNHKCYSDGSTSIYIKGPEIKNIQLFIITHLFHIENYS
jgi:hypothetical protein